MNHYRDMEPFTMVEEGENYYDAPHRLFDDVRALSDAHTADLDLQYTTILRAMNPTMVVTTVPSYSVNFRAYAAAGFATCERDTTTDSFMSWRGFNPISAGSRTSSLAEAVSFAKYNYVWGEHLFILYVVRNLQYVLTQRRGGENVLGPSRATDELIKAAGDYMLENVVWVYDNYWYADKKLYQQVQKMSWETVILDEAMKKDLVAVSGKFFESKAIYDDLGVPWKRGLMFHGPPGNGKTISIKALMHTLAQREPAIPTLYVKSAPNAYHINNVFTQARLLAPCMLVLEDIETIVTANTRSYFFNQMDGLENNDGLFVVASTNFLDRLDPGLTKRPSRFDRKYLFPLPNLHERTLYAQFWRRKLEKKEEIEFPAKLCPAMARITPGFSFAFLQECFVATLLVLARQEEQAEDHGGGSGGGDDDQDLDEYILWRTFKKQADILKKQIETARQETAEPGSSTDGSVPAARHGLLFTDDAHISSQQAAPHGLPMRSNGLTDNRALFSETAPTYEEAEEYLPEMQFRKQLVINPAAYMMG